MHVKIKFDEPPGRLWIGNFKDDTFDVTELTDDDKSFAVCSTSENIDKIKDNKNTSESFKGYLVAKVNYMELKIPKSHCEVL